MKKQSLVILFLLCSHFAPTQTILLANQFGCGGGCGGSSGGVDFLGMLTTTAAATTTESSQPTTQNAFQRAGWQTDDKGNVFIGTDDAKLLLISVGSYWPFPKDYRK
ncbi:unnamed protein product [Angiostrongylus costaricensis]|uniref:Secreted protein n=1 Tax=Angiostrongylus costaricensis TaxID=334426 RepID=A0A0R3PT90_ANGCS|nr:unnamed protein product [Angiostrongylus costaricensis]